MEEYKNLGGMINSELVDIFTEQTDVRGNKKKRAIEAAVRLWISLPEEVQSKILSQSKGLLVDLPSIFPYFVSTQDHGIADDFSKAFQDQQHEILKRFDRLEKAQSELGERLDKVLKRSKKNK